MIYTVTLNPSIDYTVVLEDFKVGELNRMTADIKLPGGKGINVSRILKRLGQENVALGFLGGSSGQFISRALTEEGIQQDFTEIEAETRINIKVKEKIETEINAPGPALSLSEVTDLKKRLEQVSASDIVVFAGSLPQSLPANFYNQLIELVQVSGARFVIDTTKEDLWQSLVYRPLLVKPNLEELEELFSVKLKKISQIIPYAEKLRQKGAQHVVVSLGKEGALLVTETGYYHGQAAAGEAVNTVGAGDSLVAGFVSVLAQEEDVLKAFKQGVAAGSATAFSQDLATEELIAEILKKVTVTQLTKGGSKNED